MLLVIEAVSKLRSLRRTSASWELIINNTLYVIFTILKVQFVDF